MQFQKLLTLFSLVLLVSCNSVSTQRTNTNAYVPSEADYPGGISGDWVFSISTPRGARETTLAINQSTATVAVGKDENGSFDITIDGDKISFVRAMSTRRGNVTSRFEGKMDSKDQLSGTLSMSEGPMKGQSLSWKAVRK